jgi:hypothetical protein
MNGKGHLAIVIAVIVASVLIAVPGALAQGRCSLATLKGTYGLVERGTIAMPGVMGLPVGAATANVALVTYDGAGNLSATYKASFGGMILEGSITGTYTVDSDCAYTDSVPAVQIQRSGTISGEGMLREVHTIFTVPWLVGGGTRWQVPVGECSAAKLKGPYSLFGQGTLLNPSGGPALPGSQIGLITYNGRGNFYGSETVNLAGAIEDNSFTGTYTVGGNCSVSADISSSSGLNLHVVGVIVGEGVRQAVHFIIAEPGWIFVAAIDRQ